jgi:uncharacterized protein YcfJ
MERHDDPEQSRDVDTVGEGETHATTAGAAAAGAVTGGVIGLTGGPIGAAIGAVGGAIVGVAAERMMHSDDDADRIEPSPIESAVEAPTSSDITEPPPSSTAVPADRDEESER